MNERKRILDLFEEQRDIIKERAAIGIEKYRKGKGTIKIVDKSGAPLKNVKVKLTQKSHEFRFGANIFMLDEFENEDKNKKYKKYFADLFNMATLPFYWDATEPEMYKTRYDKNSAKYYRRPAIDLCMEFCQEHGIEPREHALAYDAFFPDWLKEASVEEIKNHLERRYSEISHRYADKIPTIEVTNEMEWLTGKTQFYDDPDYIKWCFDTAEKHFPNNELVINEHSALCWRDACRTTDKYYAYIEANMLKGARIDAIGMQYHMFHKAEEEYDMSKTMYNPKSLYKHMDMYARFGKPLQITEVTIPAYSRGKDDEEIQAQIIDNLYTIWFSHPAVEQIVYWNLVDGYCYCANPDHKSIKETQGNMSIGENYYHGGLLRFDLSPKPAYYKIEELMKKRWHTEEELITDREGQVDFKGFLGKYQLEIITDKESCVKEIDLSKKSQSFFEINI